jgi:hypothetical protein
MLLAVGWDEWSRYEPLQKGGVAWLPRQLYVTCVINVRQENGEVAAVSYYYTHGKLLSSHKNWSNLSSNTHGDVYIILIHFLFSWSRIDKK